MRPWMVTMYQLNAAISSYRKRLEARAKASLKPKTVSDSPGQFCKLPGIGAYGARCFSPDPELLQAQGIQAADSASKIAPTCMLVAFFRTTLGALKVICEPLSIVP